MHFVFLIVDWFGLLLSDKRRCIPADEREPLAFIIQLIRQKINPYHSNIVK